jgi:hypothetical protein
MQPIMLDATSVHQAVQINGATIVFLVATREPQLSMQVRVMSYLAYNMS